MVTHVRLLWSLRDRESKSWLSVCLILNGWDKLVLVESFKLVEEECRKRKRGRRTKKFDVAERAGFAKLVQSSW